MAINKKLIHFKNKTNFNNEVANNNILDTSIVFVQDSKEIHTHGTTYKSVNWSVLKQHNGVFIYDMNGKLTPPNEWDTSNNESAVGIAIIDDNCKFVIAKSDLKSGYAWGSTSDVISLFNYNTETDAATDFDGINNTIKINEQFDATGYNSSVAKLCSEYEFLNGKYGYLGSAGEWHVARSYKNELNSALSLINGSVLAEKGYWTSTEQASNMAWIQWFDSDDYLDQSNKNYSSHYVRAFLAI